jgi:CubicO group peptidase (beta-lactamase class C family)
MSIIKNHMAAEKIPGVSVAVMREGKIILAKGYGLANVEHNVPVKPETLFQSGSVGKTFTVFGDHDVGRRREAKARGQDQ